jgi:hypothetical protein
MYSTQNNAIVITRGDSLEFKPNPITLGDFANYKLQGDDTIYFGLMDPGQYFEEALVRKVFTAEDFASIEDFVLELDPEDTLDLLPGKYFYALKLQLNHVEPDLSSESDNAKSIEVNKVITLINKTKFIICD